MPIYEFACEDCGAEYENLIRNEADRQELRCPNCQSPKAKQILSLPSKPMAMSSSPAACVGEGPSCGAPWCQRGKTANV